MCQPGTPWSDAVHSDSGARGTDAPKDAAHLCGTDPVGRVIRPAILRCTATHLCKLGVSGVCIS